MVLLNIDAEIRTRATRAEDFTPMEDIRLPGSIRDQNAPGVGTETRHATATGHSVTS